MNHFLLGTKVGMTQMFDDKGTVQPVTLIRADSVLVTQVLTPEKNGYAAFQVGIGKKRLTKAMQGHLRDFVIEGRGPAYLREFRLSNDVEATIPFHRGDSLTVEQFQVGDRVTVRGTTKGKGFQGVVKRWNFKGAPKTHGTKHTHRAPGSIGSGFPQHVLKGLKMAGHMGNHKKSVLNAKVVYVDPSEHLLGIRGAVPGRRGGYVEITA